MAGRCGVPADDCEPVVLPERANLVVHLAPFPMVARTPASDGDAAEAAYAAAASVVPDPGLMALCRRLRRVQGRAWAVLARTELARP